MTNIFSGESKVAECVREWDKLLRTQEWVSTAEFAHIFNYDNLSGDDVLAYEKAIKKAKKEIRLELAKRGMSLRERKGTTDARNKETAYPLYNKDPLHDLRILAVIEQAMAFPKRALQLTYSPSYQGIEEHVFHAHYLGIYNGRQFVYGIYENEMENQGLPFVTLAIDRIVDICRIKDFPYRSEDPKKYEKLMKDVLGASPDFDHPEVMDVVLRTHDPKVHKLLLNKPLHHSIREQQSCVEGQTDLLTLHVQLTRELMNSILYYGQGVEVVAPQELREQIKLGLSKTMTYYFN